MYKHFHLQAAFDCSVNIYSVAVTSHFCYFYQLRSAHTYRGEKNSNRSDVPVVNLSASHNKHKNKKQHSERVHTGLFVCVCYVVLPHIPALLMMSLKQTGRHKINLSTHLHVFATFKVVYQ